MADSLPLMGIGNHDNPADYYNTVLNSLPLMGIGNPRQEHRNAASQWTHYPSWGLGTTPKLRIGPG